MHMFRLKYAIETCANLNMHMFSLEILKMNITLNLLYRRKSILEFFLFAFSQEHLSRLVKVEQKTLIHRKQHRRGLSNIQEGKKEKKKDKIKEICIKYLCLENDNIICL